MTPRLHFHFITLFPECVEIWLKSSILGRAHEAGLFAFSTYALRDYATDKHRTVDDVAYGGGGGMVLKIEPLARALEDVKSRHPGAAFTTVYFSPAGRRLDKRVLAELNPGEGIRHLILICGHYEGTDQRFLDHWVDLEVSLGDFVLTGGELPAVALADALIRQQRGALGQDDAHLTESFHLTDAQGAPLLEYPHYTRPAEFRGHAVPPVLLSGDHAAVGAWRDAQAKARTKARRPDLLGDPV